MPTTQAAAIKDVKATSTYVYLFRRKSAATAESKADNAAADGDATMQAAGKILAPVVRTPPELAKNLVRLAAISADDIFLDLGSAPVRLAPRARSRAPPPSPHSPAWKGVAAAHCSCYCEGPTTCLRVTWRLWCVAAAQF